MNKQRRLELHEILTDLLGSKNAYFQPPSTVKMNYPAIVYKRNRVIREYANDDNYKSRQSYTITVIDPDPDSDIPNKIFINLPYCSFEKHFTVDNLNHDVFNVYF